jgi:hypothetical protein
MRQFYLFVLLAFEIDSLRAENIGSFVAKRFD